jgi:hypothetical protein
MRKHQKKLDFGHKSIRVKIANTEKKEILPGPMTPRFYSKKAKKTVNILKVVL